MILGDVMDEIGDRLDVIDGLRVHRYPADSVSPPAAVVTFPETYTYDETMRRGMDRVVLPVVVMVGRTSDRATRDHLSRYTDGGGSASIKQAVESPGKGTSFDSARVTDAEFDVVRMAGVDHLAATFSIDIAGPGGT